MSKTYYKSLDETVIRSTLDNGLEVIMIPKPNYHRIYGVFTTKLGGLHRQVKDTSTGKVHQIPAGAAHFLEHKLFEGENGEDAFVKFLQQGAQANAFTSYHQTSYLFSASFDIQKNIETLLDFVQTPHFTKEGVEKEKGIITQELLMYMDHPGWQIEQLTLGALYPNHPMGEDIGGTVESVNATTYEDLMLCYDAFYHPTQMCLVVVGQFDPEEMLEAIKENQANKDFKTPHYELVEQPVEGEVVSTVTAEMEVSQPLIVLGGRLSNPLLKGEELIKENLAGSLFFDLLLGPTSSNYQRWYDKGWIDSSYGYQHALQDPVHYFRIISASYYQDELFPEWKKVLKQWHDQDDFNKTHFEQLKKGTLGDFLKMANSIEYLAYEVTGSVFNNYDFFTTLDVLKDLSFEDVKDFGKKHLETTEWVDVTINPLNSK